MSIIPQSVKCDGCGKNRIEDTNHWVGFYSDKGGLYITHGASVNSILNHACGQECAIKLFARWFSEGKL